MHIILKILFISYLMCILYNMYKIYRSLKLSHAESMFVKGTRVLGLSNAAAGEKFNPEYG